MMGLMPRACDLGVAVGYLIECVFNLEMGGREAGRLWSRDGGLCWWPCRLGLQQPLESSHVIAIYGQLRNINM